MLVQPALGFLHGQRLPRNLLSGISCLTVRSGLSLFFRLVDVLVVACGSFQLPVIESTGLSLRACSLQALISLADQHLAQVALEASKG